MRCAPLCLGHQGPPTRLCSELLQTCHRHSARARPVTRHSGKSGQAGGWGVMIGGGGGNVMVEDAAVGRKCAAARAARGGGVRRW